MKLHEVQFTQPVQLPGNDRYNCKGDAYDHEHKLVKDRGIVGFDIEASLLERVVIVKKGDERHLFPFERVLLMIPVAKTASEPEAEKHVARTVSTPQLVARTVSKKE